MDRAETPCGAASAVLDDLHAVAVGVRNANMGGTPGQRSTSSASTPLARIPACTASASGAVNLMPVSTPAGTPSCAVTSAIVTAEPSGATSIQRRPPPMSASRRLEKPSVPT